MRGYGLPRLACFKYPDVGDIHEFGLKSSKGHLPGKGGAIRSYFKDAGDKTKTRRIYKRRARAEGKRACSERE